jgi:hypothetical protein
MGGKGRAVRSDGRACGPLRLRCWRAAVATRARAFFVPCVSLLSFEWVQIGIGVALLRVAHVYVHACVHVWGYLRL